MISTNLEHLISQIPILDDPLEVEGTNEEINLPANLWIDMHDTQRTIKVATKNSFRAGVGTQRKIDVLSGVKEDQEN